MSKEANIEVFDISQLKEKLTLDLLKEIGINYIIEGDFSKKEKMYGVIMKNY